MSEDKDHDGHILAQLCADKAGEDWQEVAYTFFVAFARANRIFTTGKARHRFKEQVGILPHDNRAWGAIALRAVRAGIIEHTGQYDTSGSNHRPDRVWRSLICSSDAA